MATIGEFPYLFFLDGVSGEIRLWGAGSSNRCCSSLAISPLAQAGDMQLNVKLILSPLGPHVIYVSYHLSILAVQRQPRILPLSSNSSLIADNPFLEEARRLYRWFQMSLILSFRQMKLEEGCKYVTAGRRQWQHSIDWACEILV
jgi:hypothetical protein